MHPFNCNFVFTLLLAVMLPLRFANAQSLYQLVVSHGGFGGSDCITDRDERQTAYMVGTTGELVVYVIYPDSVVLPYKGVEHWTWPAGLKLEAGISEDTVAAHFQPSAAILAKANLRYFVERHQAQRDSLWREGMPVRNQMDIHPKFWFHLDPAAEWAGKYLCFRAYFEHPVFGSLTSNVGCFRVSTPCTAADSARMPYINIRMAGEARDYTRAFALTDSLLATGWIDRGALGIVGIYAAETHHYDRWLHYLEIEFNHFGYLGHVEGEPVRPFTPESRTQYEQKRQQVLEKKAQYEHQR